MDRATEAESAPLSVPYYVHAGSPPPLIDGRTDGSLFKGGSRSVSPEAKVICLGQSVHRSRSAGRAMPMTTYGSTGGGLRPKPTTP